MALSFPDKPVGAVTPEVARVLRALKQLPDSWKVWHHLALDGPAAPDFLLLDDRQRALLLQVSRATPRQARAAPQMALLGMEDTRQTPGEAEERLLDVFLEQLGCSGVCGAVIFPHLGARDLLLVQRARQAGRYTWLDKSWVEEKGADAWDELLGDSPLDAEALHLLRKRFAPEVVVPASFVARVQRRRRIAASLGDYLLDYDQEHVLKADLDLDVEGEQLARDFSVQVVNGVTGSGKTLILLYRLRLLHALYPNKRFLVLTHNRALIRDMQARFRLLQPADGGRICWHTFMSWCRAHWPVGQPYKPVSTSQRDRLIREVRAEYLVGSALTEGMMKSELDWLKDSGITTRKEYMESSRRGRGFRLTQDQRERMFTALRAYQERLLAREEMDWWDVPRRMWRWIEQGLVTPPQYDVVMVDEAQFFAPLWFDIVRRLVVPRSGHLFIAADPAQGFLRSGDSWRQVTGLEVRGRIHRLQRSYRTTRAILDCAQTFYRWRLPEDEEELVAPDLAAMPMGKPPLLLCQNSQQDERGRVVNEVVQAIEAGLSPRQILVLHASWLGVASLIEMLIQRLGPGAAADPKDAEPGDYVRVTTINAGTGLESPIVFIVGAYKMFEEEEGLRLSAEERIERVRENTRKLYMAFTRAGQRLVLTWVGELPTVMKELVRNGLLSSEE